MTMAVRRSPNPSPQKPFGGGGGDASAAAADAILRSSSRRLNNNNNASTRDSKIHFGRRRSCRDSFRLLLLRPQFLIRIILFGVVAVCTLSLAIRLHSMAVTSSEYAPPSVTDYRILFQGLPPELKPPQPHQQQSTATLFEAMGYSIRPRVVGYYWPKDYDDYDDDQGEQESNNRKLSETTTTKKPTQQQPSRIPLAYEQLDPNMIRGLTGRNIYVSKESIQKQVHLENSHSYDDEQRDNFEPGNCKAQYEWQKTSFPTCNALHEQALWEMRTKHGSRTKILANGYWRDTWQVRDHDWEPLALKTIRYQHEYTDRNYDRHRRDGVAMERMTSSPNVVNIYSFCGNSGIFEFASGGDLSDAIWYSDEPEWNSTEKLIVAYQAASGIADLHNVDREGRASIAHTDITPSQFVFVNKVGRFLLNDFNRCRFISWDTKKDQACNFHVGSNPGTFRSPEEYRYDLESEKVDVYSLGNIFYALLMKKYPYEHDMSKKEAQKLIMNGERPPLKDKIANSEDPFTKALIKAMRMAWIHDPVERSSARDIENYLDDELTRLGVNGKPADR